MKTIKRPSHFFAWEALDVGFVDRTAWLAGYVDFAECRIVVEDEFLLARATTQDIADQIEAHERALWSAEKFAGGRKQPKKRVSDVDLRLIADLRTKHDLVFGAIEKKQIQADVNLVNMLIDSKQLLVSESCVHLRRQLREGVYTKNRKDMGRDSLNGHFDAICALRYGIRIAEPLLRENPFPIGWRDTPIGPNTVWSDGSGNPQMETLALGPDTEFSRQMAQESAEDSGAIPEWYRDPR